MGDDPVTQMRELFTAREPFYATADATVLTEAKTPEQVAAEVVRLAQISAGW
jgi:shikimate kinase